MAYPGAPPPAGVIPKHEANFAGMTPIKMPNGKTAYYNNPQSAMMMEGMQQSGMVGGMQQPGMMGGMQQPGMMGGMQQPGMMGGMQHPGMMGGGMPNMMMGDGGAYGMNNVAGNQAQMYWR